MRSEIYFSLVSFLPNIALAVDIQPYEIWMGVCVLDSSNEFAANTHYYVFVGGVKDLYVEVAHSCFGYLELTDKIEIGSIVESFCYFFLWEFEFLVVGVTFAAFEFKFLALTFQSVKKLLIFILESVIFLFDDTDLFSQFHQIFTDPLDQILKIDLPIFLNSFSRQKYLPMSFFFADGRDDS